MFNAAVSASSRPHVPGSFATISASTESGAVQTLKNASTPCSSRLQSSAQTESMSIFVISNRSSDARRHSSSPIREEAAQSTCLTIGLAEAITSAADSSSRAAADGAARSTAASIAAYAAARSSAPPSASAAAMPPWRASPPSAGSGSGSGCGRCGARRAVSSSISAAFGSSSSMASSATLAGTPSASAISCSAMTRIADSLALMPLLSLSSHSPRVAAPKLPQRPAVGAVLRFSTLRRTEPLSRGEAPAGRAGRPFVPGSCRRKLCAPASFGDGALDK